MDIYKATIAFECFSEKDAETILDDISFILEEFAESHVLTATLKSRVMINGDQELGKNE